MNFKVGSLFAGVGGICLGFQNAHWQGHGYELVWANEIDLYASETYRANFEHPLLTGDINKILDPKLSSEAEQAKYQAMHQQILAQDIDVLTAGFPCQAFSIAGEQQGFADERGNLFLSIIKLVEQMRVKPRVLFLENVKSLASHDHGRTYHVIKTQIERLGYLVKEKVLNTMTMSDLPQNRERIYIICFRDADDYARFDFDQIVNEHQRHFNPAERREQVARVIDYRAEVPDKYYYRETRYPHYFQHGPGAGINLTNQITEPYQFYQLRRGMYVRQNKSNVCPTLTANMGMGGHNVPLILDNFGIRKLTPTETFRLQGFPVGHGYQLPTNYGGRPYPDSRLYQQAGNAVSVPVITLLAQKILAVLAE